VIIGTIPIGILGIVFEDQIKTGARNLWITGSMLIVFGLVLAGSDRLGSFRRDTANLTVKDGVLGGLAQACALIPGVSRSGATIAMGLTLGQKRDTATRFAFLLAIPAVVAAGLFQLSDVANGESPYSNAQTALATLISFAVGYAAIAWLLRYVATHTYTPFVIYRVLLGATVLILIASGVLDAHTNITLE